MKVFPSELDAGIMQPNKVLVGRLYGGTITETSGKRKVCSRLLICGPKFQDIVVIQGWQAQASRLDKAAKSEALVEVSGLKITEVNDLILRYHATGAANYGNFLARSKIVELSKEEKGVPSVIPTCQLDRFIKEASTEPRLINISGWLSSSVERKVVQKKREDKDEPEDLELQVHKFAAQKYEIAVEVCFRLPAFTSSEALWNSQIQEF